MNTRGTTIGGDKLLRKLKAQPQLINRSLESVVRQEARVLCVEYARVSGPGKGMGEAPIDKAKKEVETDVRRVFATRDSPWRVFEMLRDRDPKLAFAYWNAYKSKKPRRMADILRQAGLPQGMSAAAQRAARTGKGGRVPEGTPRVSLANAAQVRVLVRTLQQRVGMAKAGWYLAAKAIGGRVRGSYIRGGEKVSYEKFTASVRKVAARFPGLGGARITTTAGKVSVEIFTSAGHARKALSDSNYQSATSRARDSLNKALTYSLQAIHKRFNKAA